MKRFAKRDFCLLTHFLSGGRYRQKKGLKRAPWKFKRHFQEWVERTIEPECREGVREKLERMKELCKERKDLYEKQNDLKGQRWKIEKSLER